VSGDGDDGVGKERLERPKFGRSETSAKNTLMIQKHIDV